MLAHHGELVREGSGIVRSTGCRGREVKTIEWTTARLPVHAAVPSTLHVPSPLLIAVVAPFASGKQRIGGSEWFST